MYEYNVRFQRIAHCFSIYFCAIGGGEHLEVALNDIDESFDADILPAISFVLSILRSDPTKCANGMMRLDNNQARNAEQIAK